VVQSGTEGDGASHWPKESVRICDSVHELYDVGGRLSRACLAVNHLVGIQTLEKPMEKRSNEPFWWALFGAGGVVAAMCLPALSLLIGVAIPLGWLPATEYDSIYGLFENPLMRLGIMAIVSLSAFHWAHRFRFTLYDGLHIKHLNAPVALLCYGSAIAFTVFAGISLYTF